MHCKGPGVLKQAHDVSRKCNKRWLDGEQERGEEGHGHGEEVGGLLPPRLGKLSRLDQGGQGDLDDAAPV